MSKNQHTILVVDPDERSYKTFEHVLGAKNSVLFVPNGKTAIDLSDSHHIDIVFISHVLNGTDGILLLESFKKRFPSLPVVLVAKQPKVDEVISAFRSGARELIVKPIDENELLAVSQKIFGLLSHKKSKRGWFLPARRKTQTYTSEENNKRHLKKIIKKSEQSENLSGKEFDNFKTKKINPPAENCGNKVIADVLFNPVRPVEDKPQNAAVETSHPSIEVFFFGPFRVLVNNQSIENWPSKKGKSIFAYLLLNHKKKIYRDILMDIFWQKSSLDSARNCLNVTIHGLRRNLQKKDPQNDYILFKDECYYFNPEVDILLDIDKFRSTWSKAQSIEHEQNLSAAVFEYERAAAMYKGEFLEEEIYASWSSIDRENLKEIYLVVLDKMSQNYMYSSHYRKAIRLCETVLEKDNCREDIYCRLMVCYYHIGQRNKALKLFRKCVRVLQDELEVKPAAATIELYKKIKESQL